MDELVGYARVSTLDQDYSLQVEQLENVWQHEDFLRKEKWKKYWKARTPESTEVFKSRR